MGLKDNLLKLTLTGSLFINMIGCHGANINNKINFYIKDVDGDKKADLLYVVNNKNKSSLMKEVWGIYYRKNMGNGKFDETNRLIYEYEFSTLFELDSTGKSELDSYFRGLIKDIKNNYRE